MNTRRCLAFQSLRRLMALLSCLALIASLCAGCSSSGAEAHGRVMPFKVAIVPLALVKGGSGDQETAIRYTVIGERNFLEQRGVSPADSREQVLPVLASASKDDDLTLDVAASDGRTFGEELVDALTQRLHQERFTSAVLLDYPRAPDGVSDSELLRRFFALDPEKQQYYWYKAALENQADVILWPSLTVSPYVGRETHTRNATVGTFLWFAIGPFVYLAPFRDQTYYLDSELQAELYDVGLLRYKEDKRLHGQMPLDPSARLAQLSVKVDRIDLDMIERKGWSVPAMAASTLIPPFLLGRGATGVAATLRSELIEQLSSGLSAQIDTRAKMILDDDGVSFCKLVGIVAYDKDIVYPSDVSPDEFLVQGLVVPTRLDIGIDPERAFASEASYSRDGVSRSKFRISVAGVDMRTDATRILDASAVRGQLRPASASFPSVESQLRGERLRGDKTRLALLENGTNSAVLNWRFPRPTTLAPGVEPTVQITVNAGYVDRSYTFALPGASGPKPPPQVRLPDPKEYAFIFEDDARAPKATNSVQESSATPPEPAAGAAPAAAVHGGS